MSFSPDGAENRCVLFPKRCGLKLKRYGQEQKKPPVSAGGFWARLQQRSRWGNYSFLSPSASFSSFFSSCASTALSALPKIFSKRLLRTAEIFEGSDDSDRVIIGSSANSNSSRTSSAVICRQNEQSARCETTGPDSRSLRRPSENAAS